MTKPSFEAAGFDPLAMREQGPALTDESALTPCDFTTAYLNFYGLDFSESFEHLSHRFGFFHAADFTIAAHAYVPAGAERTVVMVHGYYDHVGLYRHLIEYCLGRGWAVLAYDLPGHGLSSGERASIETFEHYQTVLQEALHQADRLGLPADRIAMGQSTGGAIIMTHQILQGSFSQCVLFAPLFRPVGFRLRVLMYPWVRRLRQQMPRRFANNSGDEAFLKWLREEDPLQWRGLPLQWAGAMIDWVASFSKLPKNDTPMLILQGDADGTVDWRYNIPRLLKKFPKAELLKLKGAGHHLVNELPQYRLAMWQEIDRFIEK